MPKVSVIVPNYNHSKFLSKRLSSILNQSFQDYEIILLDDASDDDSLEILYKYSQYPIVSHFIVNEENSGSPFKQWHKGIELARGELIWIAESDDWADTQFLETLTPLFSDENLALAYCSTYIADENHNIVRIDNSNSFLDINRWNNDYISDGNYENINYLVYRNTIINASTVLFRKKIYFETGGVNPSMFYAGDWLLWIKLIKNRKLAYIAKPLSYFRSHSQTTRGTRSYSAQIRCIKENVYIIEYVVKIYNLNMQKDLDFSNYIKKNRLFGGLINNYYKKLIFRYVPLKKQSFFIVFYIKIIFVSLKTFWQAALQKIQFKKS